MQKWTQCSNSRLAIMLNKCSYKRMLPHPASLAGPAREARLCLPIHHHCMIAVHVYFSLSWYHPTESCIQVHPAEFSPADTLVPSSPSLTRGTPFLAHPPIKNYHCVIVSLLLNCLLPLFMQCFNSNYDAFCPLLFQLRESRAAILYHIWDTVSEKIFNSLIKCMISTETELTKMNNQYREDTKSIIDNHIACLYTDLPIDEQQKGNLHSPHCITSTTFVNEFQNLIKSANNNNISNYDQIQSRVQFAISR